MYIETHTIDLLPDQDKREMILGYPSKPVEMILGKELKRLAVIQ